MNVPKYKLAAYERLGVTPEAVSALPQITPLIECLQRTVRITPPPSPQPTSARDSNPQVVCITDPSDTSTPPPPPPCPEPTTRVLSGIDVAITLLRASQQHRPASELPSPAPDPLPPDHAWSDSRRFLYVWDKSPHSAHRALPIEAFCCAAQVDPWKLFGIIMETAGRVGMDLAKATLMLNYQDVMQATVDSALTPDGHKDKVLLHRITGALPAPKGAQTIINLSQSQQQAQVADAIAAPAPEATIRRFIDRFNDSRGGGESPQHPVAQALAEVNEHVEVPDFNEDDDEDDMEPVMARRQDANVD